MGELALHVASLLGAPSCSVSAPRREHGSCFVPSLSKGQRYFVVTP